MTLAAAVTGTQPETLAAGNTIWIEESVPTGGMEMVAAAGQMTKELLDTPPPPAGVPGPGAGDEEEEPQPASALTKASTTTRRIITPRSLAADGAPPLPLRWNRR